MRRNLLGGALAAVLAAIAMFPASGRAATVVVVDPLNMNGWGFVQEVATGTGAMAMGPSIPPMGAGSAHLTVDATGRELFGTAAYSGTPLSAITTLTYSTYQDPASTAASYLATSLQLDVDYDLTDLNTSWQGRLVFEPYYTSTVVKGSWQTWNALAGVW